MPITLVLDGDDVEGTAVNISLGGMYIVTEGRAAFGTTVTARFRLPALKEDTECQIVIRWKKPDGIGGQFGSLRAKEVWAMNQFFKGLEAEPEPEA